MTEDKYSDEERTFAGEVARLRKDQGWTLADMAVRLQGEGIDYASTMTVSRTEKVERPVRMIEALAYGRIFERTVYELSSPDPNADLLDRAWRDLRAFTVNKQRLAVIDTELRNSLEGLKEWQQIIAIHYPDEAVAELQGSAAARWQRVVTELEYEIGKGLTSG